jgi:integrase
VRRLVEEKLKEGLSAKSVANVLMVLSALYTDLVEQGQAQTNPVRALPKATRRLIRGTHDPKQTPFLEKQADIARVYAALAQPHATVFAVGALSGLRPGEVLALEWGDIDLPARRIFVQRQVRHSRVGPTKSGKPRLVPIIEPLAKILGEWKLATGGAGLVFKPLVQGRRGTLFLKDITVRKAVRRALRSCGLPEAMTWYHCTRHTYASQHVMGGGSLATLREILGHSSVTVTERYAHLRPDLFRPEDLLKFSAGMSREGGAVVDLGAARAERAGENGQGMAAAEGTSMEGLV